MRRTYRENHRWASARKAALLRAGGRCEVCGTAESVEVHHREPVGPNGYKPGCIHHQENLMCLCPAHHREHDAARRAAEQGIETQLSLVA